MPFATVYPTPGLYVAIVPHELAAADIPVISTTKPFIMLSGQMAYRADMFAIMHDVGVAQKTFPTILCTAFVISKEKGDTDGSKSRQGLFFSYKNGTPNKAEEECVNRIINNHGIVRQWLHVHCLHEL